jgi:sporulation integral membrane protein YtvI
VTILATYFLSYDNRVVSSVFERYCGKERVHKIVLVRDRLFQACGAYIRAQLIMMCIIFVVILIGMLILRIGSPLFVAFIVALVDAIPILGTGTVLIPWALISLVMGNYGRALGLAVLYVCALTTRQFFEPKVVSSQIGLHPLITLMSMYIGLTAIGIFGMILGPIVTIVVLKFIEIERESKV